MIDGRPISRHVEVEPLDGSSRAGYAVRRGFYRGRLDDWIADYRRSRDPELRRQIIEVSLRETIPTSLTALHVASPGTVLARAATPARLLRKAGLLLIVIGAAVLTLKERWQA